MTTRAVLGRFLDGEMPEVEAAVVNQHLDECDGCQIELQEERALVALAIDEFVSIDPPAPGAVSTWATAVPVGAGASGAGASILSLRSIWGPALAAAAIITIALMIPPDSTPEAPDSSTQISRAELDSESNRSSAESEKPNSLTAGPTQAEPSVKETVFGAGVEIGHEEETSTFVTATGRPIEDENPVWRSLQVELSAGDLDGDGQLTIADLGLLARLVDLQTSSLETHEINEEWSRFSDVCPAAGDLDGDGTLTPSDYSTATKMWISDTKAPKILYPCR